MSSDQKPVQRTARASFTLIELLVVVAIIAVLVAMLLPTLNSARENARRAQCASNLHQLVVALQLYDQDNGALPIGRWNYPNYLGEWTHIILRDNYKIPEKLTLCPSAAAWTGTLGSWKSNGQGGRLHYYYFGGNGNYPACTNPPCNQVDGWWYAHFAARNDGYFPVVSIHNVSGNTSLVNPRLPPHRQFLLFDALYRPEFVPFSVSTSPVRSNHLRPNGQGAGGNVVFVDGHVEWQSVVPGRTWNLVNGAISTYQMYWTPGDPRPSGVAVWP